ncbi:hypothetical protein GC175_00515, partial [bacterium]|nr:hypothetical protein [bacterium]
INLAALDIRSSNVEVRNCRIHTNQDEGAEITGVGLSPLLADSIIEDNGGVAIRQNTFDMTPRYRNLTLQGNGTDAVVSPGGTLSRDVTLDGPGGLNGRPFILTGNVTVPAERTLRIRPGSTVRFDGPRTLSVSNRGTLIAQGSTAQPVRFTSHAAEPAAGSWGQISVAAGASAQLRHCVVEYATQGIATSARLLIDSCTFRHNTTGVNVSGSAGGTIINSQFTGNATGVNNTTPAQAVRAFGNWWNHPSGPSHSANPGGQGDPVSSGVLYQGWLQGPVGVAEGRQATALTLNQTLEQSINVTQIHDFVYEAAGGENLLLEVRPANAAARLSLLSRQGGLPWIDTMDSDVAVHSPVEGVYLISLPDVAPGSHFFTLLPTLTSPNTAYSLTLLDAKNRIATVTPRTVGPAQASLIAHGLFNLDEAEIHLCREGSPTIRTGLLHALDNRQSRISLDLTDMPPGVYDLCITWPEGSRQTLADALDVQPGNPQVRVWMENPRFVRAARRYTGYLHIASVGNVPAPAPYVVIDAVNARISLWSDGAKSGQVRLYGFNDQAPFGLLPPGAAQRIPIYMEVTSNNDVILTVTTVNESSQEAFDWSKMEASLRPAPIPTGWSAAWAATIAPFGNTWGSVIREVNRNANQMAAVPAPASPDNLLANWLYNTMIGTILGDNRAGQSGRVADQAVKLVCGTSPSENLYTYNYDAQSDVDLQGFDPATFDENQPTFIIIHGLHKSASDMQNVVNAVQGRGNIIVIDWEVGAKISRGLIFSIVDCRNALGYNGPRLAGLVAEQKLQAALSSAGKRLNTDNTMVITRDAGMYLGLELFRFWPGTPAAVWLNPPVDIPLMRQARTRFDGERSAAITVPSAPTDALVSETKTYLNWPTFWALPDEGSGTIPDWAQQRDHAPGIFVEWPEDWTELCPFWQVDDEEEEGVAGRLGHGRALYQEKDETCVDLPTYPIPPQGEETPNDVKRPELDEEQPEDPNFTEVTEERIPSLNSWDPNEKEAWVQYAMPGEVVRWTIYFENMATATAPAQEVFINDSLPAELDWSSVRMLAVGFDRYTVPFTARDNATTLRESIIIPDYRPEVTERLEVRVDAFINPQTGELNWVFTSLDPLTGDYPEDPLAGFLPPNDGTGRGEGYVLFEARILPDVALGTLVHNEADIIFDTNPPINTGVETVIAGPVPAAVQPIFLPVIVAAAPSRAEVGRLSEPESAEANQTSIYLPVLSR